MSIIKMGLKPQSALPEAARRRVEDGETWKWVSSGACCMCAALEKPREDTCYHEGSLLLCLTHQRKLGLRW